MQPDPVVKAFEDVLGAITTGQETTRGLLDLVRENGARLAELADDVATLGVRVSTLEAGAPAGHSLRVLEPASIARVEEVAEELRAELASEVAALTGRIDHVHRKALTALTALTERNQSA